MEKVYKNAIKVELDLRGIPNVLETAIKVIFRSSTFGVYFVDIFVDEKVLVELRIAKEYRSPCEAQILNELKAIGTKVGLLINFGKEKVEFERLVM